MCGDVLLDVAAASNRHASPFYQAWRLETTATYLTPPIP